MLLLLLMMMMMIIIIIELAKTLCGTHNLVSGTSCPSSLQSNSTCWPPDWDRY
jgi:hypothetical protein